MITFWVLAAVLIVIALVFLLRPLRLDSKVSDIDRAAQNVEIARERLSELKVEFEDGLISQEEYEQTQQELELSLLNDVEQDPGEKVSATNVQSYNRVAQLGLLVFVPVVAVIFYAYLGQPDLIEGAKKQAAAGHTSADGKSQLGSVEDMVAKLAERLKNEPDNAEGWFMLARSYMSLNRYKEAVDALEKTNELVPDNPVIMLRYADALVMQRGGQFSGKPFEIIKRAVELDPENHTGLWLIGMGYEEQGAYKKAISYWSKLLPLLTDEQSKAQVQKLISQAKRKAGITVSEDSETVVVTKETQAVKSIAVSVSIDENKLKTVSENDVVFIFARALQGPPMPLAVVRKQVKDLPIDVTLDDSMAMMDSMKLSSFKQVQIVARVSTSGTAKVQSGDLESDVSVASAGQKEKVKLLINKSVP